MCGYKDSRFGICLKSLPETATGFDEAFNNPYLFWEWIIDFFS